MIAFNQLKMKVGALSVAVLASVSAMAGSVMPQAEPQKSSEKEMAKKVQRSAQAFTENKGQWPKAALYHAGTTGMDLWVTKDGLLISHLGRVERESVTGHAVKMSFVGSNPIEPQGTGKVPGRTDYMTADGTARATNVGRYQGLVSRNLYPGVDLSLGYAGGAPRYDLIVKPGADVSDIRVKLDGASKVEIKDRKTLTYVTSVGTRKQGNLYAYQMLNGEQKSVPVEFVKVGKNEVGFKLGKYDKSAELVIDPLIYGSYYGGDRGFDQVRGVATDLTGGTYMTGATRSILFPTIYGPFSFNLQGGWDAFLSKFQGDAYYHDYAVFIGGSYDDFGTKVAVDPAGNVWIAGTTTSPNFPGNTKDNVFYIRMAGEVTGGNWRLNLNGIQREEQTQLPFDATAADVVAALETDYPSLVGQITITGDSPSTGGSFRMVLPRTVIPTSVTISNNLPQVNPPMQGGIYLIDKPWDIWMMRFAQQLGNESLTPYRNGVPQVTFLYGEGEERLAGFAISPIPEASVKLFVAGSTNVALDALTAPFSGTGFVASVVYNNGTFEVNQGVSRYITSGAGSTTTVRGLAVDADGNFFLSGTLNAAGNSDTGATSTPIFETTPGVWAEGRLQRRSDLWVRKYSPTGTMLYSTLIGGNAEERAAGDITTRVIKSNQQEDIETGGSNLAVDSQGNAYVVGTTNSFNYPRTRGVYGEEFTGAFRTVVITKLNRDASQLLYSTNLRTFNAEPIGMAVDSRGQAYVTGLVRTDQDLLGTPPDPITWDTDYPRGTIPTTADAIKAESTTPTQPEISTTDAWLLVLNNSATNLVYGSYLGGDLDEFIFAPHTDAFGDVWVMGWIDFYRQYVLFSSTGVPTIFETSANVPAGMLTPLAFKAAEDPGPPTGNAGYMFISPPTLSPATLRDGFVLKFRLGLPVISSMTLSPSVIAGGDPQGGTNHPSSTATVTLTEAAPAGGTTVNFSLDNSAVASFSQASVQSEISVIIPQGQTTATVPVYSRAVIQTTEVNVKADVEGNFRIVRLTVSPWLQQLSVSPTTVVGGNQAVGRVRIFQNAPNGGVTVNLATTSPSLSLPANVVVPAGQDTVTFNITTRGVNALTEAQLRATLLGVERLAIVNIDLARMVTLSITPDRIASEGRTTGKVTLDGESGNSFNVVINIPGTQYQIAPKTLVFSQGDREKTFTITTKPEASTVVRTVTATRAAQGNFTAQTLTTTFTVEPVAVTGLVLNPTTVNGGTTSVGTVTIASPAPAGGAIVRLSSTNPLITVPTAVMVPVGQTTAKFSAKTVPVTAAQVSVIRAYRGEIGKPGYSFRTAELRVRPLTIALTLNPAEVIGGLANSRGTVTINTPAPAGGLPVTLTGSNSAAATLPASVTIAAGQRTASFTITSKAVDADTNVSIKAALSNANYTAQVLRVKSFGLSSISFSPSSAIGGTSVNFTVTLEAPAPAGGAVVQIDKGGNGQIVNLPATVTIPAGSRTRTLSVTTNSVSRTLRTQVTALYRNKTASAILEVRPKTP